MRLLGLLLWLAATVGADQLVRRVGCRRLSRPALAAVTLVAGGLLASLALAMALVASSLNPALYDVGRGDVLLVACEVGTTAALLLAHGGRALRAAREHRRPGRRGVLDPADPT